MPTHLINEDFAIDHPLLKNEVVVMEDSYDILQAISNFLTDKLNWKVIQCNNQDEAVEIAKQKRAAFFILDNWVGQNKHEGLDALERIKGINQNFFVAIISAFPLTNRSAKELECNLVIEKNNITRNTFCIANEMVKFRKKFVDNILNEINKQQKLMENLESEIHKQLAVIEKFENLYKNSAAENITLDKEINTNHVNYPEYMQAKNRGAYEKCKSDTEWLEKHQGKYAAFVDGDFDFACEDRDEFFERLINFTKYKEKQIFFVKVEKEERIIDEPTSLRFELT